MKEVFLMNKEQYEKLKMVEKEKEIILTAENLTDKSDRTLLYGYTTDGTSWHVYIQNNQIHAIYYDINKVPNDLIIESNRDFVPNKRLYPETCDFEFCKLLKEKDVYLPFTVWDEKREEKIYYGKTK